MSEQTWITGGNPFKGRRIDSRGNMKYKGTKTGADDQLYFVKSFNRQLGNISKENQREGEHKKLQKFC